MRPISLPQLIHRSQSKSLKGLPPKCLRSSGTICFSPTDMVNGEYTLMSPIRISFENRITVAYAWPLDLVTDGHVALDLICLTTLGIPESQCIPLQNNDKVTPRRGKGRKSKGKQDGRSPANFKSPSQKPRDSISPFVTPTKNETSVQQVSDEQKWPLILTKLHENVSSARQIDFIASSGIEAISSEEFITMLKAEIEGRIVVDGMIIPTTVFGTERFMRVTNLCGVSNILPEKDKQAYRICEDTRIVVHTQQEIQTIDEEIIHPLHKTIRGLNTELNQLKLFAQQAFDSNNSISTSTTTTTNTYVPTGALLKGTPGTGKTLLAHVLASSLGVHLETISGPELAGHNTARGTKQIQNLFRRATRLRPSLILLDEVDALTPRRGISNDNKFTGALLALLDSSNSHLDGVFVIATSNRPDDIDSAMRRAGRLDYEIEIPIPTAETRAEILCGLIDRGGQKVQVEKTAVTNAAEIAHGFVAADLVAAWRSAVAQSAKTNDTRTGPLVVSVEDLLAGIRSVRPSSLREAQVEIPRVRWEDIGGQEAIKRRLREAVEWPLTTAGKEIFRNMGVSPPRGLLLYGPPGCSKTLLARAVATECGANFIAVKGAEVLSKWVGESEKTVRRVFERARAAAPCVVFLDEVDALVPKRGGTNASGAGAGAHARVVAQILAEMDGIRDSGDGVVVIAATNRPDRLDPAFMRRGRMDVKVHVGLPKDKERREILKVHAKGIEIEEATMESVVIWTKGFSGAEVAAVVREAKLAAVERMVIARSADNIEADIKVVFDDWETARTRVRARTPVEVLEYFEKYRLQVGDDAIV